MNYVTIGPHFALLAHYLALSETILKKRKVTIKLPMARLIKKFRSIYVTYLADWPLLRLLETKVT